MNPRYSRYYTFIRPITKNKYVKTYSSLSFSLIAIMIFGIFAIKPTVETILVLQTNIQQQQQIDNSLLQKEQDLSNATKNLNKIDPAVRQDIDNLLPSKTDITTLASNIGVIVQSHDATVSGLQFQSTDLNGQPPKISATPVIKEISFTLNIAGDYSKLLEALDSLIRAPRLISVDSVNINETAENTLVMSISARSFFLQNK